MDQFNNTDNRKNVFGDSLEKSIATATSVAKERLISKNFPKDIAESDYIPVVFNVGKTRAFESAPVSADRTDSKPITLDLKGGEKIEIGRYQEPTMFTDRNNYGIAFRILGRDPHYPHSDTPVQHPWVMLKSDHLKNVSSVIPLEKVNLQRDEDLEIMRFLAVFSPKDIETAEVEFSKENYPKILLLDMLGCPVTDFDQKSVTWEDFNQKLANPNTPKSELNSLRESMFTQLESPEDLSKLYDEKYLKEIFGENYNTWIQNIYLFTATFGQSLNTFAFPETEEDLTQKEAQNIYNFITDNNLAILIKKSSRGPEMVANPLVVKFAGKFLSKE